MFVARRLQASNKDLDCPICIFSHMFHNEHLTVKYQYVLYIRNFSNKIIWFLRKKCCCIFNVAGKGNFENVSDSEKDLVLCPSLPHTQHVMLKCPPTKINVTKKVFVFEQKKKH